MNNAKKQRETTEWKDQRSLQENWRYQEIISCKDGHVKQRNGNDLRKAEQILKSLQEQTDYTKKGLNHLDHHDGVVTQLEPHILRYEVKWDL